MPKLVLVRHGQSTWNKENRFTGWVDVDLSERGIQEAREAGRSLRDAGFRFDVALASYLKRAIRTLWLIQEELDQMYLPVQTDWRLNERHYGGLQGLNKKETAEKHGADQVLKWRRGYAIRPPELERSDDMHPANDKRYTGIPELPGAESLADTLERVIPYWHDTVVPLIRSEKRVLIVAHGNSLRAMVKYLDGISDEEIVGLNIPTGIPLVYELDDEMRATSHYYLADADKVASAENEVRNQAGAAN